MKATSILLAGLLAGALAACMSNRNPDLEGRDSMWVGDQIQSASLNQAIRVQHTLYPYHFETGSAELNDLGARDLRVLAEHFKDHPGELNVRRGDASQSLYESRVAKVQARLAQAGVKGGKVAIKDGAPGGQGMPSERLIVILKEKMSAGGVKSTGGTSTSSSSGASMNSSIPK